MDDLNAGAMNREPGFIDNQDGNTLARALRAMLDVQDQLSEPPGPSQREIPEQVRIATAFFSPAGFSHIADRLAPVREVRLLLGADLNPAFFQEKRRLGEAPDIFEHRCVETGLRRMVDGLAWERDRLPFTRVSITATRKLIKALRSGNMEVRRYEKAFLHAKAYIFSSNGSSDRHEGVIAGSSNLTGAGLVHNLELNLGHFESPMVSKALQWFDGLWEDAELYDLAELFDEIFAQRTPWEIFIRVLWQLYGSEVEEDTKEDKNLPLTNFQQHGVARALRLIKNLGGVIVADEVGLGKTFIAGEILKRYQQQRQRALLICPAALRDSTWKTFLNEYRHTISVECISYEQLARDIQLRDRKRPNASQTHIQNPIEDYQLIIVDEAHNYRNPNVPTRSAVLHRLLNDPRRHLLLLTATPVNNSLWDLHHLLQFFLRQDDHLASQGIVSIEERFKRAMKEDPSALSPEMLYPIIDATTVKRTRQFIQKHYARDEIKGADGELQPIVFPKPRAISVRYEIEDLLPGFFDRLEAALDPDNDAAVSFARYTPDFHLLEPLDKSEQIHPHTVLGLLRTGLLKRFESSAYAFRKTVEKMVQEHTLFLKALDTGRVITTALIKELSAMDDALFEEALEHSENGSNAALYNVETLGAAVRRDRGILQELADGVAKIQPRNDPKLKALASALIKINAQAQEEATNDDDAAQKRKTLIFSSFADTVVWIRDFLQEECEKREGLAPYRNRIIAVSGSGDLDMDGPARQKAVLGFAPVSMASPLREKGELYDLLISTDVLAEGVNLQQCRNIINFDIPWNPMRLVQRHGRIDRINSPHKRVFLRTVFPDDRLDSLLDLIQRILDKLNMVAASIGGDAPIENAARGRQVFSETREEIEKLLQEDPSLFERGGSASAAQTGEEYRQILRKALRNDRDRIVSLPWKIGSGMVKGKKRGIFFFAVVGRETEHERNYLRFIPADKQWRPVAQREVIERELGPCLRLIECEEDTPSWHPDLLQENVYGFWEAAQDDILVDWMWETDPANLQPQVRPLNHRVAEFIRNTPPIGINDEKMKNALDILESRWLRREENMLREWFDETEAKGPELSRSLIEKIIESGLKATSTREPLPPIEKEDIELLCWMGIEAEDSASASSS